MGWLGVCLVFVGIALFSNGVAAIIRMDGKSTAFMNAVTGLVLVGGNLISLGKADFTDTSAYYNIAAGFLFGFTYVFIAANHVLKLDLRAFGWYSVCVAVFAAASAGVCFSGGAVPLGCLWTAWAVLWLEGFLELSCGIKALGRIFPALSILEGIFAAFVPAVLMLFGVWPV
jgi:acid-activated urea channel